MKPTGAVCGPLPPDSLKDDRLYEDLQALQPDLFVVVAFRILPKRLFELPRLGSINVHASLLPKYRGAAPIHWALINGEKETGLTSFFLKQKVDTGNVILQEKIPIGDEDTYDTLSARMSEATGGFLLRSLDAIEDGRLSPEVQDESEATPAPKITPFDAMIDFGFPAENVRNFVRGLATKPGAFTSFRGSKLKVHACRTAEQSGPAETRPGTCIGAAKKLLIQCRESAVELTRVVPSGKKETDGKSFINGYRPAEGEVFGEVLAEESRQT